MAALLSPSVSSRLKGRSSVTSEIGIRSIQILDVRHFDQNRNAEIVRPKSGKKCISYNGRLIVHAFMRQMAGDTGPHVLTHRVGTNHQMESYAISSPA